ncbi:response regulator transcription factor [Bradyrhizobium sp. 180]|nr:response regulator transcription factor [Bradyrhizobium sp. CW12]MCK1490192.1 response regulator transcription factor [Bradyrhizobium sp. 180]MCK1527140.1 response regulator transcription factor [Bradyrhizobium sp. 182]MCK1644067.1 response regulator transcription factor [Bradyrhizobium sp. 154]
MSRRSIRRKRSLTTIVIGGNSLRKDALTEFLRSADFGTVSSVTCADRLYVRKFEQGQKLFVLVHTGDDFQIVREQIEPLRRGHPDGRVVVVADRYRPDEVAATFQAGANGYFVDVMSRDVFTRSIELVIMGETVFPPAFLPLSLDLKGGHNDRATARKDLTVTPDERSAQQLSPRQKSILRCVIEGDSNKCIARKIDIAESTVKVHVKAILRKIGVHNRTQAAIWGISNELSENANSPPVAPNLLVPHSVQARAAVKRSDASLIANSSLDARAVEGAAQLHGRSLLKARL